MRGNACPEDCLVAVIAGYIDNSAFLPRRVGRYITGLSLFWNFWKPENVREFCKGQGKAQSRGKVRKYVWSWKSVK